MITTIHGEMDETVPDPQTGVKLEKRTGVVNTVGEHTEWVEYWQLVHRSAHVTLKQGLTLNSEQGSFSNG